MHFTIRCLAVAVVLAMMVLPVRAQVNPLTLDEAIDRGLLRGTQTEIAGQEAAAALATYEAARAARYPVVGTQATYTRLSSNIPSVTFDFPEIPGFDTTSFVLQPVAYNRYYTQVGVDQPLFTGGRISNQIRAARYRSDAARHQAEQAAVDMAYTIRQAWWHLYEAGAVRDAIEESVQQVEAHVQDIRNRVGQGAATGNDLLAAQTRRAEVRLQAVEATNAVYLARADLNRLMGLPLDSETVPAPAQSDAALVAPAESGVIGIVETDRNPAGPVLADTVISSDAATSPVEAQPALRALESEVRAQEALTRAERAAWLPEINLSGRYIYARPNQYFFLEQNRFRGSWEATLGLNWTLWDFGVRGARIRESNARMSALEARRKDAREQADLEFVRRRLEQDRARAVAALAHQSVLETRDALRIIRARFQEGAALTTEVLDAEAAYSRARAEEARAVADRQLAEAALLHSVGRIR